ncbi:hypothetical protein XA68_16835 [Ophiocordyceps unilateralis]|uniref:Uncharacterized protein n=1 Tax=Ophiocordyceps unilateralis TaxID=268505 RepID=A0A2A9P5U5_OPHUN|nr:hypothetical protein XA68_16835 [Ophiocordyceps unilateralis]
MRARCSAAQPGSAGGSRLQPVVVGRQISLVRRDAAGTRLGKLAFPTARATHYSHSTTRPPAIHGRRTFPDGRPARFIPSPVDGDVPMYMPTSPPHCTLTVPGTCKLEAVGRSAATGLVGSLMMDA